MKNLITLLVVGLIFYSVFEGNKTNMFNNISKPQEQENNQKEAPQEIDAQLKIEENKNYPYHPSGFKERVVTNAFSDFIQTEPGKQVAKSMLTPNSDIFLSGSNIKVSNYKGFKKKYGVEYLSTTNNPVSVCGQRVKIQAAEYNSAGNELYNNILEVKIGESEIDEFNVLLDGLRKGETLKAKFLSKSHKDAPVGNILLLYVIDQLSSYDFRPEDIRIFDEYITSERTATCGDKVNFLYKVTTIDNKTLKAGEVTFNLGDNSYPAALSHVISGMPFIGSRIAILPSKYLSSSENPIIKNHPNEFVILEITSINKIPRKENLDDSQPN